MTDQALFVLGAVADACAQDVEDGVPTSAVTRRIDGSAQRSSRSVRALLRVLHRQGYVRRVTLVDEGPSRWAPTDEGLRCLKRRS